MEASGDHRAHLQLAPSPISPKQFDCEPWFMVFKDRCGAAPLERVLVPCLAATSGLLGLLHQQPPPIGGRNSLAGNNKTAQARKQEGNEVHKSEQIKQAILKCHDALMYLVACQQKQELGLTKGHISRTDCAVVWFILISRVFLFVRLTYVLFLYNKYLMALVVCL